MQWLPYDGDIRRGDDVRTWLHGLGHVDAVWHLAALVPTIDVDRAPETAVAINVGGTIHVLEAARTHPASPWVGVVSTSHVYAPSVTPLAETDAIDPVSWYGLTKHQAEMWVAAFARRHDMRTCIARVFSYSDPGQREPYFLPSMIARLRQAPPLSSLSLRGASDVRDFLRGRDVADGLMFLLRCRANGVYNVASGRGVLIADVVQALRRQLQRDDVTVVPDAAASPSRLVADISRMRALGWSPAADWTDVVSEAVTASAKGRTDL